MVETILRRLLDHPRRTWIVTTVTCLTLLVVTWPLVDDYTAARHRRAQLMSTLDSTRASIQGLTRLEENLREQLTLVEQLESRVMTAEQSQRFRDELIQLAARCGCEMRNMKLAPETRERDWHQHDHALSTLRPVSSKPQKTPFVLRTRQLSVSLEGSSAQVGQVLVELDKKRHLIHASKFRMERSDDGGDRIGLELELTLIELAKASPKSKASA